jgi:hypothetical protein
LTLNECIGITDVSSLRNVRMFNLSFCRNVCNVSALGNVHRLILTKCLRVAEVSALRNVHELHLEDFRGIDITGLEKVRIRFSVSLLSLPIFPC